MILACITLAIPSCGTFTQLSSEGYRFYDGIYAGGGGYRQAESKPVTLKHYDMPPATLDLGNNILIAKNEEDGGRIVNYYFLDRSSAPIWLNDYVWYGPRYCWDDSWYWNDPWYYRPYAYWGNPWYYRPSAWGYTLYGPYYGPGFRPSY